MKEGTKARFSGITPLTAITILLLVGIIAGVMCALYALTKNPENPDGDPVEVTTTELTDTTSPYSTATTLDTTTTLTVDPSTEETEATTSLTSTTAAETTITTSTATTNSTTETTATTTETTTTATDTTTTSVATTTVDTTLPPLLTAQTTPSSTETSSITEIDNSWYLHQVQVPAGFGFWSICQNEERLAVFCVYNAVLPDSAEAGTWYDVPPAFPLGVESRLTLHGTTLSELFPNKENLSYVLEVNPGVTEKTSSGMLVVPPAIPVAEGEARMLTTAPTTATVGHLTTTTTTTTKEGTTAGGQTTTAGGQTTTAGGQTTTAATASTSATTAVSMQIETLPASLQQSISWLQKQNPYLRIGLGVYALDGSIGYEFNAHETITSACTVKAVFARYVMVQCSKDNTDMSTTTLTYLERHLNRGSGVIKTNCKFGDKLSLDYLVRVLLYWSDNTAYNILWDRYGGVKFADWLKSIGGQNLYMAKWGTEITTPLQYGYCTVRQRATEWLGTWAYVSDPNADWYAKTLRADLTNTPWAYACSWMPEGTTWLHKSGWSNGAYNAACDAAVVNNKYLIVILTDEDKKGVQPPKPDSDKVGNSDVEKCLGKLVNELVENGTLKVAPKN